MGQKSLFLNIAGLLYKRLSLLMTLSAVKLNS